MSYRHTKTLTGALLGLGLIGLALLAVWALASRADEGAASVAVAIATIAGGAVAVALVVAGLGWRRRRRANKLLARYACLRCGYAPTQEGVETGGAVPCSRCGQLIYPAD